MTTVKKQNVINYETKSKPLGNHKVTISKQKGNHKITERKQQDNHKVTEMHQDRDVTELTYEDAVGNVCGDLKGFFAPTGNRKK